MPFELVPTLDRMMEIYRLPTGTIRFEKYLSTIKGSSDNDMEIPLAGYNPMAKDHILIKMEELQKLNAEKIISDLLSGVQLNRWLSNDEITLKVALNLSDDLKGGWTHRYNSDYDSKFKTKAYLSRNFCIPIFRSSENYTESIIEQRTLEYLYRYIYQLKHGIPITLSNHVEQEIFVASQFVPSSNTSELDISFMESFLTKYKETEEFTVIFNFLYGDNASETLLYPTYQIKEEMAGFKFAKMKSQKISNQIVKD